MNKKNLTWAGVAIAAITAVAGAGYLINVDTTENVSTVGDTTIIHEGDTIVTEPEKIVTVIVEKEAPTWTPEPTLPVPSSIPQSMTPVPSPELPEELPSSTPSPTEIPTPLPLPTSTVAPTATMVAPDPTAIASSTPKLEETPTEVPTEVPTLVPTETPTSLPTIPPLPTTVPPTADVPAPDPTSAITPVSTNTSTPEASPTAIPTSTPEPTLVPLPTETPLPMPTMAPSQSDINRDKLTQWVMFKILESNLFGECLGSNDAIALRFEGAPLPDNNSDVADVLDWFNSSIALCGLTDKVYVEELVDENGLKWTQSLGCYDDDVEAVDCAPGIYSGAWAEVEEDWLCDGRIKGSPCETYWEGDGREDGRVRLSDTGKSDGFIDLSDETCETVMTFVNHLEGLSDEERHLTVDQGHRVGGTISYASLICGVSNERENQSS